jgi:hypothetical protein
LVLFVEDVLLETIERIYSRWALKVRVRLVEYVSRRLGSECIIRLEFQVGGDSAMGSSEASMALRKEMTPG